MIKLNDSHQFSLASKSSLLANSDGVDDEIEQGRTAQPPQWWVSTGLVVVINELKTTTAS